MNHPDQAVDTFDILPYRESLYQLFLHGPTYDGDVISKRERSVLVAQGFAERYEGYSFLTRKGVEMALSLGMDREKQRRQHAERRKRIGYDRVEELVNGARDRDTVSIGHIRRLQAGEG